MYVFVLMIFYVCVLTSSFGYDQTARAILAHHPGCELVLDARLRERVSDSLRV
jgi:hypothetical protein